MEIEFERRKREREGGENGQDERDDRETPVPTELADPADDDKLSLGDLFRLMQRGMTENTGRFDKLDREQAAIKREAKEAREMAAKALTTSTETRSQIEALAKRVSQLEKGGPPTHPPGLEQPRRKGNPKAQDEKRDWDYLGGDMGDTVVVGGFREYAQKTEKRNEWEKIQTLLAEDLQGQIQDVVIPNSPGSIVIVKLRQESTPAETRTKMLKWAKDFKEAKLQTTSEGETHPRTFYAAASKPFAMRQRNAKLLQILDRLKLLLGSDRAEALHADLPKGRLFYDRTLLLERHPDTDEPIYREESIRKLLPDYTKDLLEEKIKEAKDKREADRRPA